MVWKIGSVGPQGSGKTRTIMEVCNQLIENKYLWEEEENLAGTTIVKPFTILIDNKKLIIADNPGQNSLEMVRKSVAQSGADYTGILIFVDSLQFNFREIGLFHAMSIANYVKQEGLPVALITTKADLIQRFFQSDLLTRICYILESGVQNIFDGQNIPYFDRTRKLHSEFILHINDGWIPFLELEQVLINALEYNINPLNVPGFTMMNVRLFARSILLGYCQFYKEKHPDFIQQYPIFNALYSDYDFINSLNYNRPSAMETGTPWRFIAAQSKSKFVDKNEPPFQQSAFYANNIEFVLKNYCLASPTRHMVYEGELRQKVFDMGWKFIGSTFTDSITPGGIQNSINIIYKLAEAAEEYSK
ncbi:MAG: hypothetical protein HeimC3_42940 [Candidatus Heimdallarchaeota archaeon LC_3]|nr:MAG: hypothetical protein HeimC3_42940 [Candidatus Heimdallarchaeota archaeon LC_3]